MSAMIFSSVSLASAAPALGNAKQRLESVVAKLRTTVVIRGTTVLEGSSTTAVVWL